MKSGNRFGWGKIAGLFALGAAAGSAAAFLYAPASGKVTRGRIAIKLRSMRRMAGHRLTKTQKLLAKRASVLTRAAVEKLGETREWMVDRIGNGRHPAPRPVSHRS